MKKIPLTNSSRVALLDDDDAASIGGMKWKLTKDRHGNAYAVTRVMGRYKSLHRMVAGEPLGLVVDHIDGDGLNCQVRNLRIGTQSQNMANCKPHRDRKGKYKGVHKDAGKFRACLGVDGKVIRLGRFDTAEKAARAYDAAAKKQFGEFARVNFK